MSWLRLDTRFTDQLRGLRWEAVAVWPVVLCLVKRGRGVLDCSQAELVSLIQEEMSAPQRIVIRGVSALQRAGLLKRGEKVVAQGPRRKKVEGWVVDVQLSTDPRPRSAKRSGPRDNPLNAARKSGPRDNPSGPRDNPLNAVRRGGPRDNPSGPRDHSEGFVQVHEITEKTGAPRARARSEGATYKNKEQEEELLLSLWEAYRMNNSRAPRSPGSARAEILRRALELFDASDLELVLRWVHRAPDASWYRNRGLTTVDAVFSEKKLPGRIERAQRWSSEGEPSGRPVEELEAFSSLDPEDQRLLQSLPVAEQQRWVKLVEVGNTGALAILLLDPKAGTLRPGGEAI